MDVDLGGHLDPTVSHFTGGAGTCFSRLAAETQPEVGAGGVQPGERRTSLFPVPRGVGPAAEGPTVQGAPPPCPLLQGRARLLEWAPLICRFYPHTAGQCR